MVTKTFTFTTPFSVWLLAVCAPLFDNFSVVKPQTSRRTNSEIYCVGTGFRGPNPTVLRALRSAMHSMPAGARRPSASIALPPTTANAPVLSTPTRKDVPTTSDPYHPTAVGQTVKTTAPCMALKPPGTCRSSSLTTGPSASTKQWDLDKLPLALLRRIYAASKYFHGVCQVDQLDALVNTFNFVKHSGHTPKWQQKIIQCIRNEGAKGFHFTWEQWLEDNPISSISRDKTHNVLF